MPLEPIPVLGHPLIDRQHRRIVEAARAFLAAARLGRGLPELGILVRVTRRNFASEERLMSRAGYPTATGHRGLHASVLADMDGIRARLRHGETIHRQHALLTISWLAHHADEADRRLVRHLRRQSGQRRG